MKAKRKNVVEYRIYDLPLDFPVILLHGEEWRISDVLSNRLHFHNCFEIGLCHTDSGVLVFEDRTVPFRAGDVTCIPRHIPHTTCSDKGTLSRWSYLFFDLERLSGPDGSKPNAGEHSPETSPDRHWVFSREDHPRIHFLVTCVIEEMLQKKPDFRAIVQSLLTVLCLDLIRLQRAQRADGTDGPGPSFTLKPAFEHIASNYRDAVSVGELAGMCGLSVTHFRRLFVSVAGESPIGFLNITRINRACALLLTTSDSILSIAGAVGFSAISSFNRYFSQVTGISPREYRNPARRDSIRTGRQHVVRYKGWIKPETRPASTAETDQV